VGELDKGTSRRALICEPASLVAERARQMLAAEGFTSCVVDDLELFHELRRRVHFDAFLVGVAGAHGLDLLGLPDDLGPLLLLAPLGEGRSASYRLAMPGAILVDRSLRDPDALRRVLCGPEPEGPESGEPDRVRRAFLPFGLSERQLEVLASALRGDTSRQIAGKLFISELTVRNHLHAIYERVGVSGRRELLGRFVQGLIEGTA
jgi:DNA-binding CsgD family transcriptional regulator